MDDDASVAPAPLEMVAVFISFTRMQCFVEERPRQLFLSVNLQRPSCSYTNILSPKIAVLITCVVRSVTKKTQQISR